jgi:hypothetical protein
MPTTTTTSTSTTTTTTTTTTSAPTTTTTTTTTTAAPTTTTTTTTTPPPMVNPPCPGTAIKTDCCKSGFPSTIHLTFSAGCSALVGISPVACSFNGTNWVGTATPANCAPLQFILTDAGSCKINITIQVQSSGAQCIAGSAGVVPCPLVSSPFSLDGWLTNTGCGCCTPGGGHPISGTISP